MKKYIKEKEIKKKVRMRKEEMKLPTIRGEKTNTYECQRGPIRVHGLYSTLKKIKEKKRKKN